jgi:site-specific DNA-methyltransferase (adenine-specific)
MSKYALFEDDSLSFLSTMPSNTVEAIITDPPYELGFMGKGWDQSGIAYSVAFWTEALRVLKPGGHLIAFSGARTYHRMACAIEDAGFEIRDQIMWLFGQGMPKSRNIARYDLTGDDAATWEGWGTALKPANEPICMARKPLAGTVAANVLAHGTGALNIDACRIDVADAAYARTCSGDRGHAGTRSDVDTGSTNVRTGGGTASAGRWPANVIHDGSDPILAEFAQYGEKGAAAPVHTRGGDKFRTAYGAFKGNVDEAGSTYHGDTGTAARFFYCAKATQADREEGNTHPTVKPTALMRYLVRLVTPPGGTVLDPFMGSGTTGKACMLEGFDFVGIDQSYEYVEIAEARIERACEAMEAAAATPSPQIDLFEGTP